jgi:hypothetical protein
MLTQFIKQSNVVGIAANTVATARIPTSGTHYGLILNCLQAAGTAVTIANMKTAITNIVLRHNGEQIMEGSATFFLDLHKFYMDSYTGGAANVNGVLPIPFAPQHFNNYEERRLFAVGTSDIQTMTLDITLGTLSTLSSIEVYSEITPEIRPRGQHIRIKKYPQSFATTGEQEISTLPLEGPSVGYKALHVELGTNPGVASYATLKVGNYAIHDQIKSAVNTVALNFMRRTPQAAYYHVDLGKNNAITSYLPMAGVQDFRLIVNWTTQPTNFNIYAEEIFGLIVAAGR